METEFLTRKQVADILSISKAHLDNLSSKHKGPPYIKFGSRSVRYNRRELQTWIEEKKIHNN